MTMVCQIKYQLKGISMFIFKSFWIQIVMFVVLLLSSSYFLNTGWLDIALLVIFLISNYVITTNLIDDFQDIEGNYIGSDIGSFMGGFIEGWTGNISGQGFFQEVGESLGGFFDEDGIDYSEVRKKIHIESIITYLALVAIFSISYFFV